MRSLLYTLGRLMGDYRALQTGRVGQRIYNRMLGRMLSRLFLR